MASTEALRVLLVEDDEDDYLLTRSMLCSQGRAAYQLDWEQSYPAALGAICAARHDVYLIDYRLGGRTGLDLVREAWDGDPSAPVIVLTGQDDYEVDLAATELGVTDYLIKGAVDGPSLERAIRYAVRQHRAMVDLRRSEERYAIAVQATNDGIVDCDLTTGSVSLSERGKALFGHDDSWGDVEAWFGLVHPDDIDRVRREFALHLAGITPHFEGEFRLRGADGEWFWALTRGVTTRDANRTPMRLTAAVSDVTEQHKAQEQLSHDALHDSLTALPNRALFNDRLVQCLKQRARDPAYGCAVLFIDVDRFKLVNDSLSHATGDRLLIELARRVRAILRPGDTLARLGGDEFTILLDGIVNSAQAVELAARASEVIAEPLSVDGHELSIAASIGIAHTLDGTVHPEELVRDADLAMYYAKGQGGGRCEIFDARMHELVVQRVSLETELRHAIDDQLIRTFFQPIVDLHTGALHGFEALARWPAGDDDIPPSDFIPVAEEAGLIAPLGALVLRSACKTLSQWRLRGLVEPEVTVNVNVSIRQITDGHLSNDVRTALHDTDLPPANLVLEITESILMENQVLVNAVLGELMNLGVTIELDDFGTGYSSLTALHDFPGDTLKIDRTFVDTMLTRTESHTIVRSIVHLAHDLGLAIIAEGIETSDQLQALAELGCEYGQGYHFARPLPANEIEALLTDATLLGVEQPRTRSAA
jgi:diguanylate cyclase (GGDEF)-like protein/PAS domain S-box-containing protein